MIVDHRQRGSPLEKEATLNSTDGQLNGQVAIVTGAASGIGRAVAVRLARAGATVVGADLDERSVTAALPDDVVSAAVSCDVADEDAVRALVAAAEQLGGVDILVNVAGIGSTTNAVDTDVATWDRVMEVNARGTFLCCKHAIPAIVRGGGGTVVNIASIAGLVGLRRRAAYCASKGAVIALTRALAVDHVDEGVRVNCVCPGTVDSPWVRALVEDAGESLDALRARQPMGRVGTPEEVAEAVYFLAGPGATFATGSALVLDGGLTAA